MTGGGVVMLNRVFNVVFNYSLGVFTAVSELCRRRHKTKSISRSQSLFNALHFNLSRLSLGVLIGCGLISTPTWAVSGFVLKDGKLVYCSDINTTTNTCTANPSTTTNLSSDGTTLTWNGSGGFSTPKITLSGKVLAYNSDWATAVGGNTGLSFDGKPITPYYGVNSAASGGNYYGQGAAGTGAIAIGYGASSTNLGTIAIGQNASAKNKHAIAIGLNAKVISDKEHGIAIGGGSLTKDDADKAKVGEPIDYETDAAMAGRNAVAIGYNVRMGEAAHSFGLGTNMIVKGVQNFVLSAASSQSNPTKVYGQANTVIGANNLLDGKSIYQTVGSYEKRYGDIVSNLVFGDGNTITGTADVNATSATYSGSTGAYKNIILGPSNTLSGNNYHNRLLASDSTLNTGAHHNTLIGSKITVNQNIGGSYVLGSNVNVTANNSVYFGDASTAYTNGILTTPDGATPTTITTSTTAENREKYAITIGELGQTKAVIGGRSYNFAGLGEVNGGVISVGRVVGMTANNTVAGTGDTIDHYASIGRIIQNVAPGLIGASSTDAVNGSQLYAVMTAVDSAIARVASGESGPVVYTTDSGERLYKENNIFYKTEVTTLNGTTYQQASNGLWYPASSFEGGLLSSNVNVNDGKTLAQLAEGRTSGDNSVVVPSSSLVLSAVNAEKDSSSSTEDQKQATTTLTALKNIKNALAVLASTALENAAKELYKAQTTNATDATWAALSPENKKPWLEKAIINNAKTQLTALLGQTNARVLSQAVNLQDLQTLAYAGLDFAGDSGTAVHRNLSQTLTITGGETSTSNLTALADKNIGVVTDSTNGALNILLAKNLTNLSSVQLGQTYPWTTPVGDYALSLLTGSTYNNLVTKVDNRGIHLGYTDTKTGKNIEKASFTLLGPDTSLPEILITPTDGSTKISPIFATADNGGRGTIRGDNTNKTLYEDPIGKEGSDDKNINNNNGYLFNSSNLGLVVGSLAEGAKTSGFTGTGTGFEVFVGLRNGVLDTEKVPKGQPIIFDLSNAATDNKKKLPGFSTTEKSSPIAIGAYNTIIGNSGLAVGSLNRVYGNGGIVVGTTSIADGYSTVGRFGITMGFNVKAGEWSQQSVAIGANLQAVGRGNIILGGGWSG